MNDTLSKFQQQVEFDIEVIKAKIDLEILKKEAELEAHDRRTMGLTHLEQDASVIFASIQKAVIELTFCHEMGKTQYVIDKAVLRVTNTRLMYDSVCRKIFKLCLKHGLKSEHMK